MLLFPKDKIAKSLFFSLIFLCYSYSFAAPDAGSCKVHWNQHVFTPTPDVNGRVAPDYGLYWIKSDNSGQELAKRAYMPIWSDGTANTLSRQDYNDTLKGEGYFDPSKPTVIFIHGWQPNATRDHKRVDFCYRATLDTAGHATPYRELRGHWKDWNIGVFYWNQFADETGDKSKPFKERFLNAVLDVQSKIYTPAIGHQRRRGMRWAYLAAEKLLSYCDRHLGDKCIMPPVEDRVGHVEDVGYMAYRAFVSAFPKDYAKRHLAIRILGQSLGAQVAIQLTYHAVTHDIDPTQTAIEPTRLSLFDPYFSTDHVNGMKQSVAEKNVEQIEKILSRHPDFSLALYRATDISSPLFHGSRMKKLMKHAAFYRLHINFLEGMKPSGVFNQDYLNQYFQYVMGQHEATIFVYLKTKSNAMTAKTCFNANVSDDTLRQLRGTEHDCDVNAF